MASPKPYSRGYSFSGFQATAPASPLPGPKVDQELDNLGKAANDTIASLAKIQRGDGKLQNGVVTKDALSPEISSGVRPTAIWEPGLYYEPGDTIAYKNGFYRCVKAHVSTNHLDDDIEDGFWEQYAAFTPNFADQPTAEAGDDEETEMNPLRTKQAIWARKATVSSTEFGISEGASDNKAALEFAFAQALADGKVFKIKKGRYPYSTLTVPAGLAIEAVGATLAREGAIGPRNAYISFGTGFSADILDLEFDGTEQGTSPTSRLVYAADDFRVDTINLIAMSQLGYNSSLNGLVTSGVGTRISSLVTRKIDYPLSLINSSLTDLATGSVIGEINAEEYLRVFYASFCSFKLREELARKRSPNADAIGALDGGRYISNLLEGCQDYDIGLLRCEESGHALRIGGSPHANATNKNGRIARIFATKTRGTLFKIAPSRLESPGVTEKAYNIVCDEATVIDCGDGVAEGNRDVCRITHGRSCGVGRLESYARDYAFSGQVGILLNDCDDVAVGLGGLHMPNLASAAVVFSRTSDITPGEQFPGPVTNIQIGDATGSSGGSNAISFENDYGPATIGLREFSGFTTRMHASFGSPAILGPTLIYGSVSGDVDPIILNPSTDARFRVDVSWKGRRRISTAGAGSHRYALSVNGGTLDLSAAPGEGSYGTIVATSLQTVAGLGVFGGSLLMCRPGSNIRGAGIALEQDGPNAANTGLAILTTGTAGGGEALNRTARFWSNGDLELFTQGRTPICKGSDGNRYRLSVPAGPGPVNWVAL